MKTSKSPLTVLLKAFGMARHCLRQRSSDLARHDLDLWQFFACLVLREHRRESYRCIEAVLREEK